MASNKFTNIGPMINVWIIMLRGWKEKYCMFREVQTNMTQEEKFFSKRWREVIAKKKIIKINYKWIKKLNVGDKVYQWELERSAPTIECWREMLQLLKVGETTQQRKKWELMRSASTIECWREFFQHNQEENIGGCW